ncbi:MAG: hypothetical protein IPL39_21615 [Opitutaceae bacterium]|nr:hypothetical protein [Opitutaceae bacterium]
MRTSPLLRLLRPAGLTALLAALPLLATTYEYALGDPGNRTLRLNIPASVTTARGILIWGNGSNSDLRSMATDPEFVALAESMGFAVLGTAMWDAFFPSIPDEFTAFQNAIAQLATTSGHPELSWVPWLPVGHSNGGSMSYGSNTLQPARTIALAVNQARGYNNTRPSVAALATPGLLLAGGGDTDIRRTNIRDLFEGNRPRGALWAWAEQEGLGHAYGDSFELILPFAAAMEARRYPDTASPRSGPIALLPLAESEGWLVEPSSHLSGLAEIAAYADYPHDRTTAGWLPNRRLAYIFRAYASHGKPTETATVDVGHGPVAWGTTVTYTIGPPAVAWSAIEYYEGDVLLGRTTPATPNPLTITHVPTASGYSVYHALITLADGTTRRTTPPRRVFVRAAIPQAPTSFKDDIGYTALKAEYPDLPTGANLTMLMCDFSSAATNWSWAVQPGGELAGKTITYLPAGTVPAGYSPHATGVTTIVAGNDTGLLPGIPAISSLWADNISSGLLRTGERVAPNPPAWDFEVITWNWSDDVWSTDMIRRMDWQIDQQGVTVVEAISNERNSPVAYTFTSGYNLIVVGVTSGEHNSGPTRTEVPGRAKPDIVAPTQYTSGGTPTVAGCAGLIIAKAKLDPALAFARDPRAVKALLLAGATKEPIPTWSHTPTQPLDAHFGAGQVNIAHSYHMLLGGRQAAGTAWAPLDGWDKAITSSSSRYFVEVPVGQVATLSAALVWHRIITPNANWSTLTPSLADLNLRLATATASFGVGTTVAESRSTIENVEHLYETSLPAGRYVIEVTGPSGTAYGIAWRTTLVPNDEPLVTIQPSAQSVVVGASALFSIEASGTQAPSFQWYKSGVAITGATDSTLFFPTVGPAETGLYDCAVTGLAGSTLSAPTVLGVVPATGQRTAGDVSTRAEWQDIHHPNGAVYDQFLLTGSAGTFTADPGQIARCSYLDSNDSIVQVEMSGAGAITINLDNASGPMAPTLYNQSDIQYMKGKATITLSGADASTHFTIYSVGTGTNLSVTRPDAAYAGWADVAVAGILSTDGGLGGIHQGNTNYNAAVGYTGLYAPNTTSVGETVVLHGIAASGAAQPYLFFGPGGTAAIKIAGGSLAQPSGDVITVSGLSRVTMGAGQDSCGRAAPAQAIQTRLIDPNGSDVTSAVVVNP